MAEEKKLSKKVTKLVDEISKLTVLELSDLVGELQDKLGVSAIPMAAAAPQAGAPAEADSQADEGGNKTVVMTDAGSSKIAVIKVLKEINSNLGLKEAKDMTEATPVEILKDAKPEEAKEASEKLKSAGATVELK